MTGVSHHANIGKPWDALFGHRGPVFHSQCSLSQSERARGSL